MLKKGNIHILNNKKYIILTVLEYEGVNYAFASLIADSVDNLVEEYIIFYYNGTELKYVNDIDLANKLVPIFREDVKKIREEYEK